MGGRVSDFGAPDTSIVFMVLMITVNLDNTVYQVSDDGNRR